MNYTQQTSCHLHYKINHLRQLMISTAKAYGLSSVETLRYSEELDKLIIQVQLQDR